MPKRKSHKKSHTHHHHNLSKPDWKKSKVWTSSWTFSIITIGLTVFVLGVIITFKQNVEVLGIETNNNVSCQTQRVCACAVDTFCLFCKNQTTCTPIQPVPSTQPIR